MIVATGSNITEALQEAASFLRARGIGAARLEAELMLAFLMGVERPHLYTHGDIRLTFDLLERYGRLCRRRSCGEPLAYIRKEKEFMGLPFHVDRGVFVPRPETEHLVEEVLQWAGDYPGQTGQEKDLSILDLGTGSGCIAVSLAYYLPRAGLVAVDCDRRALVLARRNSVRHGVESRISLRRGSFYKPLESPNGPECRFAAIVCNPPYIEEGLLPGLPPEVQREPRRALSGGVDGLEAYREILAGAGKYLRSPGLLALELGARQAPAVISLAQRAGFSAPVLKRDYAGIERVLLCRVK